MEDRKLKILSIDGGGLRGIVPLQVIKKIENITGRPIHKSFDLIAGTSTGGLIACALTLQDYTTLELDHRKYSIEDIEKIYVEKGSIIFPLNTNIFIKIYKFFTKWFRPEFDIKNLNSILQEYFGENRITSCLRPIFIPSFDIHRNQAINFTSREASTFPEKNPKLVEVCKATSAAPTYFQSHKLTYDGENIICIDGGITMNNPSLGALIEILANPEYKYYKKRDKNMKLNDIMILSLGTGKSNKMINSHKANKWGRLKWIKPIIDISIGAPAHMIHKQLETLFISHNLEKNYLRIDIDIDEKFSEMSDSREETIKYLLDETNSQITQNHTLQEKLIFFLDEAGIKSLK